MTPRQLSFVNKAIALVPAAARAQFQRSVGDLLAAALHPLDDRGVLDTLRPLLARHGVSVGALLPPPRREYARIEKGPQHALL
jgi:hypothetical protein